MTEKERLTELIDNYTEPLSARDLHKSDFAEKFAAFLLENGVIVLPVKVGDTVYVPDKKSVQEYTVHAVERDEKHLTIKCHSWLAEREGLLHKHTAYFNLENFGKTVFLIKEEAEAALAERSQPHE